MLLEFLSKLFRLEKKEFAFFVMAEQKTTFIVQKNHELEVIKWNYSSIIHSFAKIVLFVECFEVSCIVTQTRNNTNLKTS